MADDSKGARDSQSLAADLLRRVTSPEVLAGVAGAGAAAYFTKHMVEDEADTEELPEETDEAQAVEEDEPDEDKEEDPEAAADEDASDEDEPDDEVQDDDEQAQEAGGEREEPEADGGERDEPRAADDSSAEDADEAEPDDDEDDGEREEPEDEGDADETSDEAASANGSLGSDDERMKLVGRARRYAEELTGHPVEGISSVEQEDRGWRVGVEVLELARIPSTTDVLASYEVVLDTDGEFVDFRRGRRYSRNSTDDDS